MNKKKSYTVPTFTNFRDLLCYSAKRYTDRIAFQIKEGEGAYRLITYGDLRKHFYGLCGEFIKRGLLGQRIAVSGANSYGWVLSYLCAATVGVAVPIDRELSAADTLAFWNLAECRALCADDDIFEKLSAVATEQVPWYTLADVAGAAFSYTSAEKQQVDFLEFPTDETRVLLFTSGTTSHSKGVCLSHNNICANVRSTTQIVNIRTSDKTLSILPLHHTYECTINCLVPLSRGACVAFCDGLTKVQQNALEYNPTVLVVVPALLKVLRNRIRKSVTRGCPAKFRRIFEEKPLAEALSEVPFVLKKMIRAKVKKSLGGKLRLLIVGAADLDPALVDDFSALGLRTLQGYGLTECAPLLAANSDFFLNPKSTGRAVPGVTLKIVNPNESGVGEIAAKGENIMLGYHNDAAATDAVMKDGFFHTGDLGYIDEQGALFIKGRMKNVIVTDNGKNIYPEELEAKLSKVEAISESFVLAANDRNGDVCVKAKILPDIDFIKEKLGRLPSFEDIHSFIKTAIDEINSNLPSYMRIRVTEILEKGLERTTTRKIKRYGPNLS